MAKLASEMVGSPKELAVKYKTRCNARSHRNVTEILVRPTHALSQLSNDRCVQVIVNKHRNSETFLQWLSNLHHIRPPQIVGAECVARLRIYLARQADAHTDQFIRGCQELLYNGNYLPKELFRSGLFRPFLTNC